MGRERIGEGSMTSAPTLRHAKELLQDWPADFKGALVIRALFDMVQKQHEALKDVTESVAITESMGEICQKDDFIDVRAALALSQPWIEAQGDKDA
jgi:hypothetical protein